MLGRGFLPEEERPESAHVVILSHAFWRDYLGGSPDALGKTLSLTTYKLGETVITGLHSEGYTIVGVMPPGFTFPFGRSASLWTPLIITEGVAGSYPAPVFPLARLKKGVTPTQAEADLAVLADHLRQFDPKVDLEGATVRAFKRLLDGARGRPSQAALAAAGSGGIRPIDRLRQRRQLVPGSRHRAPARDGHARGPGRFASPGPAADAHGEPPAQCGRRCPGLVADVRHGQRTGSPVPVGHAASPGDERGPDRPRFHPGRRRIDGPFVWHDAGVAGLRRERGGDPEGGVRPDHDRPGLAPPAQRPGGVATGPFAGSADRVGPADPQPDGPGKRGPGRSGRRTCWRWRFTCRTRNTPTRPSRRPSFSPCWNGSAPCLAFSPRRCPMASA